MPRVVLVEPDAPQREALAEALRGSGFAVEALDRARAALDRLLPGPADLLVIASRLPDGSGLEVVARLRSRHDTTFPIVVTSPRPADRQPATAMGADEVLAAPVAPAALVSAAARLLRAAGTRVVPAPAGRVEPLAPGGLAFGRYRVRGFLGRGSSGVVLDARDEQRGDEVALKVLAPRDDDPAALARFVREARVLAAIDDPHVVRFLDAGAQDGRAWCAMRRVHGPTLEQHVLRAGPLSEPAGRGVLRGLLRAIAALRRGGAVHRDITPRNVLLADASPERPVLVDFGLAKRAVDAQLTAPELVLGTPGFLAPEVLAGAPADARSDMFAAGLVTIFALEGREPFPGLHGMALVELMSCLAVPVPAWLSAPLRALLGRLTAVDPAARPATPEEALRELEPAPAT